MARGPRGLGKVGEVSEVEVGGRGEVDAEVGGKVGGEVGSLTLALGLFIFFFFSFFSFPNFLSEIAGPGYVPEYTGGSNRIDTLSKDLKYVLKTCFDTFWKLFLCFYLFA